MTDEEQIAAANDQAARILEEWYENAVEKYPDIQPGIMAYNMFIDLAYVLVTFEGFDHDELMKDLEYQKNNNVFGETIH